MSSPDHIQDIRADGIIVKTADENLSEAHIPSLFFYEIIDS